jgi:hypothetical protein
MVLWLWACAANGGASIIFAAAATIGLIATGKHKRSGETNPTSLVGCFLLAISVYTMLLMTTGYFYVDVPIATTIRDHFGEGRVAWMLIGLLADSSARFYVFFDP